MNTPESNKNIAIWSEQSLDTWHDIIVSFEYCRFNRVIDPTGGFSVGFFNSTTNMPHDGGPDNALGYNPSDTANYCRLNGFGGLDGAFVGVGFDSTGKFALPTNLIDGTTNVHNNSFAIRLGVTEDYRLLYNSSSINYLNAALSNFFVDEFLPNGEEPTYRAVRIILTKNSTELKIQLKQNINEENFTTVYTAALPEKIRTGLKVCVSNTTSDPATEFKLRNFNVAGYPGEDIAQLIPSCTQYVFQPGIMIMEKMPVLPVGKEFVSVPFQGNLLTYTTNGAAYRLRNTLYGGIKLLGDDGTNIVATFDTAPTINVYSYLGQKMALKTYFNTPDNSFPVSGDIDGNTMVVCTTANNGAIYSYEYNVDYNSASIGTWSLTQTILASEVTQGTGLGLSVALDGNNLLVGNFNQIVHAFQKNVLGQWQETQTITCPNTGITRFGASIDIKGRDALIAAPYSLKSLFNTTGEGEVFHYYLNRNNNKWNAIMAMGNFYSINSVAGNFGQSVRLQNNTCIIGSPGEMWRNNDIEENIPNVGRAYVFRKASDGYFTQGTTLSPVSSIRSKYLFFGQAVNMYSQYAFVAAPYWYSDIIREEKSYVNIFDTNCIFDEPPPHLPVPVSAVDLVDKAGYTISFKNDTYLIQVEGAPLVNDPGIVMQSSDVTVISGDAFKLEVEGYGTDPLYYWWYRNGKFTTKYPVIGLSALESNFASVSDNGIYYTVVSNVYGSLTSSPMTITVYYLPYFTQQPQSATVKTGSTYALTAVATGNPFPTLLWQRDVGFGFTNITPSQTNNVLLITNNTVTGYQYRCAATNTAGTTYSNAATITVTP